MGGHIDCPTRGFTEFSLYRESFSDIYEIVIGDASYTMDDSRDLTDWLVRVGIPRLNAEKITDWMHNVRTAHINLETGVMTFPEVQLHPIEEYRPPVEPPAPFVFPRMR